MRDFGIGEKEGRMWAFKEGAKALNNALRYFISILNEKFVYCKNYLYLYFCN